MDTLKKQTEIDYGVANPSIDYNQPPPMILNFKFPNTFLEVTNAILLKHNWKSAYSRASFSHVEQIDDDRIVLYRRKEFGQTNLHAWDEIIINRADKSVELSAVGPNPDGTMCKVETARFVEEADKTQMQTKVWDLQGMGADRVEVFKKQVKSLFNTMAFTKWHYEGN